MQKSKTKRVWFGLIALALVFFVQSVAYAGRGSPPCMANDHGALPLMNQQVLYWMENTPNQYMDRAYVDGRILKVLLDRKTHLHLQVQIGRNVGDTIEIVYNKGFGRLPMIIPGMYIEVCGDYITSRAPTSQYPASPEGALIHWVHVNTNSFRRGAPAPRHEDGFLKIDGVLYGNRPGEYLN